MDKCRYCDEPATIYVEGRPTCLDCTRIVLEAPNPATKHPVRKLDKKS
jgi:hypothetical protein